MAMTAANITAVTRLLVVDNVPIADDPWSLAMAMVGLLIFCVGRRWRRAGGGGLRLHPCRRAEVRQGRSRSIQYQFRLTAVQDYYLSRGASGQNRRQHSTSADEADVSIFGAPAKFATWRKIITVKYAV